MSERFITPSSSMILTVYCNHNLVLICILTYKGTKNKDLTRLWANKPKLLFLTKLELD
jgi:hypothetical protein